MKWGDLERTLARTHHLGNLHFEFLDYLFDLLGYFAEGFDAVADDPVEFLSQRPCYPFSLCVLLSWPFLAIFFVQLPAS